MHERPDEACECRAYEQRHSKPDTAASPSRNSLQSRYQVPTSPPDRADHPAGPVSPPRTDGMERGSTLEPAPCARWAVRTGPENLTGTPPRAAAGRTSSGRDGDGVRIPRLHESAWTGSASRSDPVSSRRASRPDGPRTRRRAAPPTSSRRDSFEVRDQWLASGMETGPADGYATAAPVLVSCDGERHEQRHRRRVHRDGRGHGSRVSGPPASTGRPGPSCDSRRPAS